MTHPAQLPLDRLLQDCNISRTRRSGPGGQHRNKVETAIVVEHLPSGILGEASERRSQEQNRKEAIHRLRIKLALAIRQTPSIELSVTWMNRVKRGRISVNQKHEDFPALLAEALDVVGDHKIAIPEAAEQLRLTSSQLIKFLKIDSNAFTAVNRERQKLGLSPLH